MIEIKIMFASVADAAAFLASREFGNTLEAKSFPRYDGPAPTTHEAQAVEVKRGPGRPPKSAPTEAGAASTPTAAPAPTPPVEAAPATPKIEYAPLGELINKLVEAGQTAKIKALFTTLTHKDGASPVKRGGDVADDSLADLKAGLERIKAEAEETMS